MPLSMIFEDIGAKEFIITIIKQTQECVDWLTKMTKLLTEDMKLLI